MNYALNHEVVTGQKLPTKGKKKKSNFFWNLFWFHQFVSSQNIRILQNFNLTQKSECSKQQILCSTTHQLNDHKAIPIL